LNFYGDVAGGVDGRSHNHFHTVFKIWQIAIESDTNGTAGVVGGSCGALNANIRLLLPQMNNRFFFVGHDNFRVGNQIHPVLLFQRT